MQNKHVKSHCQTTSSKSLKVYSDFLSVWLALNEENTSHTNNKTDSLGISTNITARLVAKKKETHRPDIRN
jgi:hypothetical protein